MTIMEDAEKLRDLCDEFEEQLRENGYIPPDARDEFEDWIDSIEGESETKRRGYATPI